MTKNKALLTSAIVFGAAAVVIFCAVLTYRSRPPSDQKLLAGFNQNRDVFEQIRVMVDEDRVWEVSPGGTPSGTSLAPERETKYRQLFSRISHPLDVVKGPDGSTKITLAAGGALLAVGSEWSKGVEYIPGDPEKIGKRLANLDDGTSMPEDTYIRNIGGRWFLFYQKND